MKHNSPVYRAVSFRELLQQKFNLYGHDFEAVLHFLLKFKFVRKVTRGKEILYMVGSKSKENMERFQVDEKYLEMQLERMKQQEALFKEQIKKLKPQFEAVKKASTALDKTRKQRIFMKIKKKIKDIKSLQQKMLFLTNRLEQFRNAQTDVEMKQILEETNKTLEGREDVVGVLQNAVDLNHEMNEGQEQITGLLGDLTEDNDDILKAFNELDVEDVDFNQIDTTGIVSEQTQANMNQKNEENRIIEENQLPDSKELRNKLLNSPEKIKQNGPDPSKIYNIKDVKNFAKKKYAGFGEVEPGMNINQIEPQVEVVGSESNPLSFGQQWKSHKPKDQQNNEDKKNYDQFKREEKMRQDAGDNVEFHGTFRGTNQGTDSLCAPSEMNGEKGMKNLMSSGQMPTNQQTNQPDSRRVKSAMEPNRHVSESQTKTIHSVPDRNFAQGRDPHGTSFVARVIDYGLKWFGSGQKNSSNERELDGKIETQPFNQNENPEPIENETKSSEKKDDVKSQKSEKVQEEIPANDYRVDFSAPPQVLENQNQSPTFEQSKTKEKNLEPKSIEEKEPPKKDWEISEIKPQTQNESEPATEKPKESNINEDSIAPQNSYSDSRMLFNTTMDYIKRPNDQKVGNLSGENSNIKSNTQILTNLKESEQKDFPKPNNPNEIKNDEGNTMVQNLVQLDNEKNQESVLQKQELSEKESPRGTPKRKKSGKSSKKKKSARKSSSKKSSKKKMKFTPWGQKSKNSLKKDLY